MPTITFVHHDGTETAVRAEAGNSVMRTAVLNNVEGIIAECGGNAMCATCHVFTDAVAGLPAMKDDEDEMLDGTAEDRREDSRLSCQLPALDGLLIRIPESQL